MRIGLMAGGHCANVGGGLMAVLWHIKAFKALGHDVTVFVSVKPHSKVISNWVQGVSIAWYQRGVEKDFNFWMHLDHFQMTEALAPNSAIHYFYPMDNVAPPPDGFRLFSNSQYTADAVKAKFGRGCQPLYIPIDATYHSAKKEPIILHVSRFAEPSVYADKGHRAMIQSIRRIYKLIPGWRLIMVGAVEDRQDGYWSELIQSASGLPIEFIPDMPQNELVELFSHASIYWHATGMALANIPSAQEHLGLAPLEAAASGAVCICYNSGGIPEVVQNGRTGILFDDPRELGDYTVKLIGDMRLWAGLHQQGLWWGKAWQDFDAFKLRIQAMLEDAPIPPMPNYTPEAKYTINDVTCVIPTYNQPESLQRCLDSLKKTAPEMRVLIINNGLPLSVVDKSDNVKIIDAGENLGFSSANKLASTMIDTPLVLTSNDDCEYPYNSWLSFLLLPMNRPDVGIVGAKLLFGDGRIQHCGGAIDFNRPDPFYHTNYGGVDGIDVSEIRQVPFCTAACMLIRKELFEIPDELIGGLNFEEIWMSNTAREKGFATVYQPASVAIHHEGLTKKKMPDTEEKIRRNLDAVMKKWYTQRS